MKIDLKLIIIILLSILSVFFFFLYINSNDDILAAENRRLMKEVKLIEKQRDSLAKERNYLRVEFDKIEKQIKERDNKISALCQRIIDSKKELDLVKNQLKDFLDQMDKINKEIERIKKFPPKREGEDLINSLTKKMEEK